MHVQTNTFTHRFQVVVIFSCTHVWIEMQQVPALHVYVYICVCFINLSQQSNTDEEQIHAIDIHNNAMYVATLLSKKIMTVN